MRNAHARLVNGLLDSHFDAVLENLDATLQELAVSSAPPSRKSIP
jgi:truncated hemoglobin YjbI